MTFCNRMPVTANVAVIYLIVFITVRAGKTKYRCLSFFGEAEVP